MADDLHAKAAEMMKKVLTVGMGAFFLTEESLRALVTEFKLPKELLTAVMDSAHKTKDEFIRTLSKEMMSQVMERVDPSAFLEELVAKHEIELQVKINLKPKKKKDAEASE